MTHLSLKQFIKVLVFVTFPVPQFEQSAFMMSNYICIIIIKSKTVYCIF